VNLKLGEIVSKKLDLGTKMASGAEKNQGSKVEVLTERSPQARRARGITRVISFTSGKGGVGKTNTVINIAIGLSRLGRRVLVLDADLGLANVDVMLGVKVEHTLQDVFEGEKSLEEVIISGPEGISIIPSTSGVESFVSLDSEQRVLLCQAIEDMSVHFDYLLIDTSAGIDSDVMYFNSASSEVVCLINPEPTSITDAYALIKILSRSYGEKSISILTNNAASEREALGAFKRLARAVERFLHVQLRYIGYIPSDDSVRGAIQEQRALLEVYPSSAAARAITSLANKIDAEFLDRKVKGGMQFFFKQLLEVSASGN